MHLAIHSMAEGMKPMAEAARSPLFDPPAIAKAPDSMAEEPDSTAEASHSMADAPRSMTYAPDSTANDSKTMAGVPSGMAEASNRIPRIAKEGGRGLKESRKFLKECRKVLGARGTSPAGRRWRGRGGWRGPAGIRKVSLPCSDGTMGDVAMR